MKKIICLLLVIFIIAGGLVGCSSKRKMFNVNLEEYVTLPDYKSMVVDRTSDIYKEYYNVIFENYVSSASAYDNITSGTVKDGDTVNIDYVGKKDGVAFDGGTANGQNLVIGSNSYIDGFESGLIGKEVGSTVDLNLTFPSDYQQTDLAGKAVVFTVKINYIQVLPEMNYATAVKLGFKDAAEMLDDLDKNTIKNTIAQNIIENSSVKKYSEKDKKKYDQVYDEYIENIKNYTAEYNQQNGTNVSFEEMLYYNVGGSSSELKSNITSQMETEMIFYSILDKEGIAVTEEDIDVTVKSMVNSSTSEAQIRENYKDWTLETITVERILLEHLMNTLTVK